MSRMVAIVGRPNVGKSTFFNRLIGKKFSIEDPTEGVTRDRLYGRSDWNGVEFSVIDTGGYLNKSNEDYCQAINQQVLQAIDEADIVLFMVDVQNGITPDDIAISNLLRKKKKNVFLIANKADNIEKHFMSNEFYELGYDKIYPISAINGSGTGDLLDSIVEILAQKEDNYLLPDHLPKFCITGRPNVGKSSLLNALLGQERSIVSPERGTTRDAIHSRYNLFGFDVILIDTAGLRKKSKIDNSVEFYASVRAIRAIEMSDVCMLMIDATRGIEAQDLHIYRIIYENKKGVVVLVNKWDLVKSDHKAMETYKKEISEQLKPFNNVPILFISALNKQRIYRAIEISCLVYQNRQRRIPTHELNEKLLPFFSQNPPPMHKGKKIKIKYITQLHTPYPSFVFFCNHPQYIKENYKRFVEKYIRQLYDFEGVPMILYFREK